MKLQQTTIAVHPFLFFPAGKTILYTPSPVWGRDYRCKIFLFQPQGTQLRDIWPQNTPTQGLSVVRDRTTIDEILVEASPENRYALRSSRVNKAGEELAPRYFFVSETRLLQLLKHKGK